MKLFTANIQNIKNWGLLCIIWSYSYYFFWNGEFHKQHLHRGVVKGEVRGSKRGELKKTLFSRRSHEVNCNAINRAVGLVVMRRLGSILNSNHCVTLESGCLVSSWKSDVDLRKEVWSEVAINILAGINIDDKWACADIVWWTKCGIREDCQGLSTF